MDIIIHRREDTSVTYEQIVDLHHESFKERLEQGLRFTCSFMDVNEYKRKTEYSVILVAIIKGTKDLVGAASLKILLDNNNQTYAYEGSLAIKPDMKRLGIGTRLEEERVSIAVSNNCNYIIGDTAVGAKSSIKWHKKMGTGLSVWSHIIAQTTIHISLENNWPPLTRYKEYQFL